MYSCITYACFLLSIAGLLNVELINFFLICSLLLLTLFFVLLHISCACCFFCFSFCVLFAVSFVVFVFFFLLFCAPFAFLHHLLPHLRFVAQLQLQQRHTIRALSFIYVCMYVCMFACLLLPIFIHINLIFFCLGQCLNFLSILTLFTQIFSPNFFLLYYDRLFIRSRIKSAEKRLHCHACRKSNSIRVKCLYFCWLNSLYAATFSMHQLRCSFLLSICIFSSSNFSWPSLFLLFASLLLLAAAHVCWF
ncbi:unnamed protein product [Ceratitis capitata]|uniref:(Mediterranean fruit fly) hypothetical protein n=1 Tax=Ceratitis capitata TaxID=7213 RepID=A0A811U5E9_CERCA|nr:unnamed protein product [Ceratitis capitata]